MSKKGEKAAWLAAHARWHHAVPDAVTLGLRAHVPHVEQGAERHHVDEQPSFQRQRAGQGQDQVEQHGEPSRPGEPECEG